ncbi:Protein of unknown function [Pyronema omphalodes CBS 100304]|uniref:Uncharacterized protein n=1 Tax=Pyronema omphalodes (strain CBS 100304) TaxID=1076935 RepID=U4KZD1_PYROM|nr:Protein of unknown function [Pyronema omphalodes CBS 100304]
MSSSNENIQRYYRNTDDSWSKCNLRAESGVSAEEASKRAAQAAIDAANRALSGGSSSNIGSQTYGSNQAYVSGHGSQGRQY